VPHVDYLNLEYLITRSYDFAAGIQFDPAVIPDWVAGVAHAIVIIGMVLSFFLLVLVVYAQIRMVQTEHEGFHALEEEEHEEREHGPEGEPHKGTRWDEIVALSMGASAGDWRRAILEADIMLADALDLRGYSGPTVADQLRQANPIQMTTLDVAWAAHKVRNQVAHEGEALQLSERDVRATIDQYKRVFEELGVL
jgi:hypothetical protein